ncbi:unnamed protein product [Pieris macdunnoughi]|uniref:Uncharacterized protein n=1 Tax=Pieris macdunnoughi TaxID=345717 RepID=A0A821M347_9NEOP|nr:unnamed protein product [Pieris macdunnoughi]
MQFPIDGGRAKRSPQNDDESQLKDETRIYVYPCRTFRMAAAPRAAVSLIDPTPESQGPEEEGKRASCASCADIGAGGGRRAAARPRRCVSVGHGNDDAHGRAPHFILIPLRRRQRCSLLIASLPVLSPLATTHCLCPYASQQKHTNHWSYGANVKHFLLLRATREQKAYSIR